MTRVFLSQPEGVRVNRSPLWISPDAYTEAYDNAPNGLKLDTMASLEASRILAETEESDRIGEGSTCYHGIDSLVFCATHQDQNGRHDFRAKRAQARLTDSLSALCELPASEWASRLTVG